MLRIPLESLLFRPLDSCVKKMKIGPDRKWEKARRTNKYELSWVPPRASFELFKERVAAMHKIRLQLMLQRSKLPARNEMTDKRGLRC
jgi:hypothetical protein